MLLRCDNARRVAVDKLLQMLDFASKFIAIHQPHIGDGLPVVIVGDKLLYGCTYR